MAPRVKFLLKDHMIFILISKVFLWVWINFFLVWLSMFRGEFVYDTAHSQATIHLVPSSTISHAG